MRKHVPPEGRASARPVSRRSLLCVPLQWMTLLSSSRRLVLGFAIFAALFFLAMVALHPFLALGVLFVSHLLILCPTLVANCQWWGRVITYFETPRREVWLTIDDGPDPVHTPRMLQILLRFEAKATFFVIGERAAKYPAEMESIRAAGHEIANHTWSHLDLAHQSEPAVRAEIMKVVVRALRERTGKPPSRPRPAQNQNG